MENVLEVPELVYRKYGKLHWANICSFSPIKFSGEYFCGALARSVYNKERYLHAGVYFIISYIHLIIMNTVQKSGVIIM